MKKDKQYHANVHRRSMEKRNAGHKKRVHHPRINRQKADEKEESKLTNWMAIHLASLIRYSRTMRGVQKSFERRKT